MLEVAKRQSYIDFWSNTIYTFQRTKYEKMTQTENSANQTHGVKEIREAREKIKTALHEIATQMEIILTVLEKETKPPPFPDKKQINTVAIPECPPITTLGDRLNRGSSLSERHNLAGKWDGINHCVTIKEIEYEDGTITDEAEKNYRV